jgi:repressor LexA
MYPPSKTKQLTERQAQILQFISNYFSKYGYPPTRREITKHFQLKSTYSVEQYIRALKKKGYLIQTKKGARTMEISGLSVSPSIPIVRKVISSQPILSEENLRGNIVLNWKGIQNRDSFFLQINGEERICSGVSVGDYVLITPIPAAKPGDMIACVVHDEPVIRYFDRREGKTVLYSSPGVSDKTALTQDSFRFLGKVIAVLRFLENPSTL